MASRSTDSHVPLFEHSIEGKGPAATIQQRTRCSKWNCFDSGWHPNAADSFVPFLRHKEQKSCYDELSRPL